MSYIFTSTASNNRQTTSDLFLTYHNPNQISGPVSTAGILALSCQLNVVSSIACANIGTILASKVTQQDLHIGALSNILNKPALAKDLFAPPQLVTSFGQKNLHESVAAAMAGINFTKQSTGQFAYYKGPANQRSVNAIIRSGGDMDTRSAFGTCNIYGYLAMSITQKLLLSAMTLFAEPPRDVPPTHLFDIVGLKALKLVDSNNTRYRKTSKIKHDGVFFPYFNGLCMADKNFVPGIISRYFNSCIGSTAAEIEKNMETVRKGWLSLGTSDQGIMLSHVAYCFDMAMRTGSRIVIYQPDDKYMGCILLGTGLAFSKSGQTYLSKDKVLLKQAVEEFDLHGIKLNEILTIVNTKLFPDTVNTEGETEVHSDQYLVAANITTPRLLHNLLRNMTLSMDETKTIRQALEHLRFDNSLYQAADPQHISIVVRALSRGEFLEDDAPIAYKTEAMFTKDSFYSCLAAFGDKAPSVISDGTNVSFAIPKTGPVFKKDMQSGLTLQGVPIFMKPLQQATKDWKNLRDHHTIHLKVSGLDKKKYTKLPGVSAYLAFEDKTTERIQELLNRFCEKEVKQTLKRKMEEGRPEADSDDERIKKAKRSKDPTDNLSYAIGLLGDFAGPDEE